MAVIAANNVTSTANAANSGVHANASANGDAFAAMLDQLAQDLTNGMAVVSADAASDGDDDAATQDDATATPPASGDATASTAAPASDPMLAQLLAAQQAASNPLPTASGTPTTKSSDASTPVANDDTVLAAATTAALQAARPQDTKDTSAAAKPPTSASADSEPAATDPIATPSPSTASPSDKPGRNVVRDGGRQPDDRGTTKEHRARLEAAQPSNPSLSNPVQGNLADTAETDTPTTPAPDAAATQASVQQQSAAPATPIGAVESVDPAEAAATLAATNQAASGVVANGTITKPGKPATGIVSSDSSKSQGRNSKASALADAGDVTRRGFASEPAVRAGTLPVQDKSAGANSAPAQLPQHNAANPATLATQSPQQDTAPAQAATAVQPAPAHVQPGAQPANPGASTATIGTAASPTQTPAHLAAQIQVTRQTPDVTSLAVSIAARSADGQKHFDIRLDPAELGRVDVRLSVDDAGKAQALLSVEKPQTLELLQKDSSHLERALKEAGLDLSQNGLNFSLKGQQQQQTQDHTPFARGQRLTAHAVAAIDDIIPVLSTNGVAAGDTHLDIRV